ncbi:PH domain-containing protein [Patescibacteria group bacterium]|nr:PH domain-containing protein [Patescibacteria group bacterium]
MFRDPISNNLKEDEEIDEIIRKHWGSFIKQVVVTFVLLVLPFFFIVFFFSRWWTMLIFFIWVTVGISYGIYQWLMWYLDSLILTNQRVINIDQKSLFSKSVAEIPLEHIQDITYEIDGIAASLFGFGMLNVASEGGNGMRVKNVANPQEIQELIFDLKIAADLTVSAEELVELIQESRDNAKKKK